ncbi:hypothetical protein [Streptomyces olivaceus]|uniref:hypothetical protein n=1 Tax=Streptomyces olivaceus TaxID=47716 RepID=UPI00372487F7
MTTATRARQLFDCTCDRRPEPHLTPVPRVVITPADIADPSGIWAILAEVWYDLTLFHGPKVPMIISYEQGESTGAADAACAWAVAHGFPAEPHDDEFVTLRIAPYGFPQVLGEDRPVYRYAA